MTVLFCHIGWMKQYQGQTPDDQLRGGGSYVTDHQAGHEVCNFATIRGKNYGYVQVSKKRDGNYQAGEINLRRLGVADGKNELVGATIIWTATDPSPNEKRRKVVGWYQNATIFRHFQSFKKQTDLQKANRIKGYWISAPASSCVLLPEEERDLEVPRMIPGFPGISPVWYADSPESSEFVHAMLSRISAISEGKQPLTVGEVQTEQLAQLGSKLEQERYFSDTSDADERERLLREVVQRRGQSKFRNALLRAYGGRCAVTGCDAVAALEAAHLIGYKGLNTQHVCNGVLLRADIHTLFDLGLVSICPITLTVFLANSLRQSSYANLHGKALILPPDPMNRPSSAALEHRWRETLARVE